MVKEYLISFSSFYKAAYAQEVLWNEGLSASLRKLPVELVRSCGTGLYMKTENINLVEDIFQRKEIVPRGIFQIADRGADRENTNRLKSSRKYIKIV
jgi:hypothetical protein